MPLPPQPSRGVYQRLVLSAPLNQFPPRHACWSVDGIDTQEPLEDVGVSQSPVKEVPDRVLVLCRCRLGGGGAAHSEVWQSSINPKRRGQAKGRKRLVRSRIRNKGRLKQRKPLFSKPAFDAGLGRAIHDAELGGVSLIVGPGDLGHLVHCAPGRHLDRVEVG